MVKKVIKGIDTPNIRIDVEGKKLTDRDLLYIEQNYEKKYNEEPDTIVFTRLQAEELKIFLDKIL